MQRAAYHLFVIVARAEAAVVVKAGLFDIFNRRDLDVFSRYIEFVLGIDSCGGQFDFIFCLQA